MGKCLFLRKGETHTKPIGVILASDLAVGSSVYLMENGAAASWMLRTDGNTTDSENYSMYACLDDGSVDYYSLNGYLYLAPAFCF